MCVINFLAMFSGFTISCRNSISFYPINTMASAYANTFNCSLPIFIPQRTIFILCIIFCNATLNNIADSHPLSIMIHFQKKKDDCVSSNRTSCLLYTLLYIFINLLGILNSSVHFHSVSLCIEP
jgi:hypothetical protein